MDDASPLPPNIQKLSQNIPGVNDWSQSLPSSDHSVALLVSNIRQYMNSTNQVSL